MCEGCFFVSHGIVFFLSRKFFYFSRNFLAKGSKTVGSLNPRNYASRAIRFFSPTDDTDNTDFNSSFSSIRSLAAQEVALQICTDFTPPELLFFTEVFFISHGMHGYHGIYASRAFRI